MEIYNRGIGGVDRFDQNLVAYMINHRSKKWWWPIFRFCLDLTVNNAFHLYKLQSQEGEENRLDLFGFRRFIVNYYTKCNCQNSSINSLIAPYSSNASAHRRVAPEITFDRLNH